MRPFFRDWAFKGGSEAARKLLSLIAVAAAARLLGDARFGELTYVMTLTGMLVLIAEFGLNILTTREISAGHSISGVAFSVLVIRLGLTVPYVAAVWLAAQTVPAELAAALYLFAAFWWLQTLLEFAGAIFIGRGRFDRDAALHILSKVLLAGMVPAALLLSPSVASVAAAYVASTGVAAAWGAWQLLRSGLGRTRPALTYMWQLARASVAVSLTLLFTMLYFKIDIIMLQYMTTAETVGIYGAAFRILEVLMSIPATLTAVVFPRFARRFAGDRAALPQLFRRALALMAVLGAATCGASVLLAPLMIQIAFGQEFTAAIPLLRILITSLAIIFINYAVIYCLTAQNLQRVNARAAAVCFAVNIGLNALLIPRFQAMGAAWATVITEGVLLALTVPSLVRSLRSGHRQVAPQTRPG